jgi:predicted nucleic acid-binding protein
VAEHLIDTDVYVNLIRTAKTLPLIRELYEKEAPGIYFSSVVAQELLAGVRTVGGKRHVEALLDPFERMRRIITPGHREWKETGDLLSSILRLRPDVKNKLPGLINDCLIALSARAVGATLYTRNREDFTLLQKMRSFSLVIVH